MKSNACTFSPAKLACFTLGFGIRMFLGCLLLAIVLPTGAADRQYIHYRLTSAMTNATVVAQSTGWKRMDLAIGLPLRDQDALDQLLKQINDPASTNFHHYLTPEEFTERFGPTKQDYEAIVHWAQTHGFTVMGRHSNRMLLDVRGMSVNVEQALHVRLRVYQHPTENRTFYAPDREPSIDLNVPVLSISGLDNFELPHPMLQKQTQTNGVNGAAPEPGTGSGPSGTYMGYDFRAAYVPGVTLTGTGQTVGLLEFESGYYTSDILRYETLTGLPAVPVQAVLLDGYNGGAGGGNDEVSLDIEMAISMAPGLSGVLVYEGASTDDILNRMATDNLAKQIGASWTYPIDATSDQIFKEFAMQGQTFFNASGDSDAYTGTIPTPSDDTNIICVGGTTLTTSGPDGAWVSETVWNWGGGVGSSGGISTRNAIPYWQTGIDMTTNQGSTTMRNIPDVAMVADNVLVAYGNGQLGDFGGTSCATPLWAAFTALMNELALTNREPLVGFINPAVYAIGKGSNSLSYTTLFHDITTGTNESPKSPDRFSAVPGYDLCTGWGTPTGSNLLMALAMPEPLQITPGSGVLVSGPVGGPFNPATITYTLTNKAAGSLNWTVANTSSVWSVFPTSGTLISGGPAATVTANLSATVTNLPAGSYLAAVQFTNLDDGFGQTRLITLAIVTPPVITAQPANQAVLMGMSGSFHVSTATNALLYYQWQHNGGDLTDGGNISGSATSTLTVSNVAFVSPGNYSVIVSNVAGVAVSSNALLSIVPSPPVIVQQPTNQTVLPGGPATFNVGAVGNAPYSYQWQFNGTNLVNGANISGATNGSLTINNVYPANLGLYSVIVSDSLGSATSTGAALSLISVTAPGVALQPLWSFTGGSDGEILYSPLTPFIDGYMYGTALEGGTDGDGTVFRANTNGTVVGFPFDYTDGAIPYGGLLLSTNNFYGTTYLGGAYGDGTIFRANIGGGLTTLVSFNGENGMLPVAGLTQGTDGNYYGTTLEGGDFGDGTVFKMTAGGAFTILVSFNGTDGAYPSGVLVQGADGNFYGTTELGGASGDGTIFKVSSSGMYTLLYSFTDGNDGAEPIPGLTLGVDGNFYGNTITGGSGGYGTIFQLTSSGALNTLYSFTNGADGGNPWGGLMQASDGNLYGTAQGGGTYGDGTVFRIAPDGPLVPLVELDGYEGADPSAALVQMPDGDLYGTTEQGGSDGVGAIFKVSVSGALQITGQPADESIYPGGTALFTVATFGSSPVFYQWQRDGTNLIDSGNISGANTASLVISNVTADDVALYSVVVSNSQDSVTSDFALLDVILSPPDITRQPVSLIRVAGTTASFSVTATGDLPLLYQWQENGTNLIDGSNVSGSTNNTLTLADVTSANAGIYSVIVSNPIYMVSSSPATLTVVPAIAPGASFTQLRLLSGGSDGAFPYAGLIQGKDGNLYGTTVDGGSEFDGTIFRWNLTNGLTTLYSFPGGNTGANPYGALVQGTSGVFYGTTYEAGSNFYGTVFRMTSSGSVTSLYSFAGGTDGADPYGGLIQAADGNYYGTALEGGADSYGSVFKVAPNGALTGLYQFTDGNDGAYPYAGLIQGADGNLYGTAFEGGAFGYGTVFRLTTNGTLTTLVSFGNTNGSYPQGGVVQGTDGRLYGTTYEGGNGYGTVFSLTTNGTLTTLFSFSSTNGANPAGALLQASDGNFYGTTSSGGPGGQGSVFKLTTNGVLTTLLWFDGYNGANPQGTLIQATNGCLYGTTPFGGTAFDPSAGGGYGTIFEVIVPVFITNSFAAEPAIGNLPYTATIAGAAIAPAGDPLSFSKVSGPGWLSVATNGVLSGTPPNSDIGTNIFVVSLADSNGVSASAILTIAVNQDPPPVFVVSPFTEPWANVDEDYSGTIATNAFDLELTNGDVMTFAKVSGPAWLTVAPDGTLSGTPEGTDAGSNIFSVNVVNLGGLSNMATMFVYVSSPPYFTSADFTRPAATVGLPYSSTIATNATDPDIGAGDVLAFYKVTGPAWLNVATNGALSGTPALGDVGAGDYLMLVVDSGDLAGVGMMSLTVNTDAPPVFASNPFTEPHADAGQAYTGTIATNVSDPNFGDAITLSKVSGPAWLNVAANGVLSGTPTASNVGTNSFVVSATDIEGVSSQATMFITVAGPINLEISCSGGQVVLSWSGGYPPYQVQMKTNMANTAWGNVGAATSSTRLILTQSNWPAYFRVQGR